MSFGALIATEISKIIRPKFLFLISSVHLKSELPLLYRFIRTSNIIQFIPSLFFKPIPFVANYLFGAQNETLLRSILDDTDLKFTKWALIVLCYWNNKKSFIFLFYYT